MRVFIAKSNPRRARRWDDSERSWVSAGTIDGSQRARGDLNKGAYIGLYPPSAPSRTDKRM